MRRRRPAQRPGTAPQHLRYYSTSDWDHPADFYDAREAWRDAHPEWDECSTPDETATWPDVPWIPDDDPP